jgi:alpha-amylase
LLQYYRYFRATVAAPISNTIPTMSTEFSIVPWAATTNIYEVNIRQYTPEGNFAAFAKHLPRLSQMGVEVLWLMPIFPISKEKKQGTLGSYYACSSYTNTNPEFGTAKDFKALVQQAHELGMKIMLDWVGNHTGYDHEWTTANPGYFKTNETGEFFDSHGWVDVIDLNYENQSMRRAMIEAMQYWVTTYDIDGFRCDMAHLVPIDFWRQARTLVDQQKPLLWLAETEEPAYHQVFDITFTWRFLHLLEDIYRGHAAATDLLTLVEAYDSEFPEDAMRLYFISNHDENSHSGSEYERLGNAVRACAVLCLTAANGIPLLYSGQEIPNKKRILFFDKDTIDWTSQCMLEDFYATLLRLRKNNTALSANDPNNQLVVVQTNDQHKTVIAFIRKSATDAILVMVNLSGKSMIKFKLTDLVETGTYRSIWSGLTIDIDNETDFELEAWEYLVYEEVK